MASYTVKAGDTLSKIATQYGTTVGALATANKIADPNKIGVGQVLQIGGDSPAPAPVVSSSDISSYRTNLSNLTNDGKALTTTPQYNAPTPTVTPDGKALTSSVSPSSFAISSTLYPSNATTPTSTPAPTPTSGNYTVKAGDSLSKIAGANGMTLAQLLALNPTYASNPNLVQAGATINLGGTPSNNNGGSPTNPNPNPTPTPTPTPSTNMSSEDLAKAAAAAGLSVSDYLALQDRKSAVTKEESDKIAAELGIPALEGVAFAKPSKSTEELFNSAYATSGLADIKTKIAALDEKISAARANLTEATGAIDENPFLTEASRVGRGKRLVDQANATITNLQNDKQQYLDLYNEGITEINNSILRQTNDFKTNATQAQAQLNYLLAKADKEVSQLQQSKSNAASGSIATFLNASKNNEKPDVIGTAETGYYKYDKQTGKFVQVVGAAPKSVSSTEARATQKANQEDDIASVVVDFQNQIQQKGWKGINPDAYQYYKNQLITTYGASAALALDKAIKDAGLSVDYGK